MVTSIVRSSLRKFQTFSNFTDEKKMKNKALVNFVTSLIRENAQFKGDYLSLFVCDLDHQDKKMFLSHLVDIDLYKELTGNLYREIEAFAEYEDDMQHEINEHIDDVYYEIMESAKQCQTSLT